MSRFRLWLSVLGAVLMVAGMWTAPMAQSGGSGTISGTVTQAGGGPMEGVLVSARAAGKSFTTSVFTDRTGAYSFPALDAGQYRVWAQAVGFDTGRSDFALTGGRANRAFTLTRLTEPGKILRQMSGAEYMLSLPQETLADRRMAHVYKNNCTACHTASYTLQNRWDTRGWGVILDLMTTLGSSGAPPSPQARGNAMIRSYRDELADYLGRVRGASELTTLKPLPRPTGEATQVVITEYDLPRPDRPLHFDDGSDWIMGTPSRYVGRAAHDLWVDPDGNVWMADDTAPGRTIAKLDPRTGKVTDYVYRTTNGEIVDTHSVTVDRTGKVWATNGTDGTFLMFDPRTEQFRNYMRPADMKQGVGGTLDADSKGNVWATSTNGAIKLEAATGRYIYYPAPSADQRSEGVCGEECGGHSTYGITVDRDDNAWITQPGLDRIVKIDSRTGDATAVILEPRTMPEATEADIERRQTLRSSMNTAPPQHKAPRRNATAPNGDLVWTAYYTSDRLGSLNTKTLEVKEYPVPTPYSMPYATAVDKNGVVWISTINLDRIVKFDPRTERFTEYVLPTRGTEIRHIQVNNRTNMPEVWAPYNRTNKIVRLQFRTGNQLRTE